MRKGIFLIVGIMITMCCVNTGCTDTNTSAEDSLMDDSLMIDTLENDTLSQMIEETPMPEAADELFDDFFFNYAASGKVQRERTEFPITVDTYGKTTTIERKKWIKEHFFMNQGYYTLIFNSAKEQALGKDTAVSNVTVEKISFAQNKVTRWHFQRIRGQWRMDGIKHIRLKEHQDAQFLTFYNKFSTDSIFQQEALAETMSFTGPDPDDDFATMTGEIMPEQWTMFVPWMPSGTLYNIVYGEKPYKSTNVRFFLVRGIANGLMTDLIFTRKGNSWQLKKINT